MHVSPVHRLFGRSSAGLGLPFLGAPKPLTLGDTPRAPAPAALPAHAVCSTPGYPIYSDDGTCRSLTDPTAFEGPFCQEGKWNPETKACQLPSPGPVTPWSQTPVGGFVIAAGLVTVGGAVAGAVLGAAIAGVAAVSKDEPVKLEKGVAIGATAGAVAPWALIAAAIGSGWAP